MVRILLAVLLALAFGMSAEAGQKQRSPSMKGSKASVIKAYRVAKADGYTFLRDRLQVLRFARAKVLVPVRPTEHLVLSRVSHPYARPIVARFLGRLAAQYHAACGERLVVTSLVRPIGRRLHNSSRYSVHPVGMAIDLRIPRNRPCRQWLHQTLLDLERAGVIDATRERRPPHYHVVVYPGPYQRYIAGRQ